MKDAARRLVRAVEAFRVAAAWAHRYVNCVFPAAAAFSYHAACPWCYWHGGVDSWWYWQRLFDGEIGVGGGRLRMVEGEME